MADGSTSRQDHPASLEAAADLSAKQFHFVKLSSGKMNVTSSQGERMVGINADKPAAGQHGSVLGQHGTIAPLVAGANGVTVDSEVTTDTAARGENAASGDWVAGFALGTAAEGEQFSLLCVSPYVKA